jgi:hypothetical protein
MTTMSIPHLYRGHAGAISCRGCTGALERCENFWQASQVEISFEVSSIIVGQYNPCQRTLAASTYVSSTNTYMYFLKYALAFGFADASE